MNVLVINCGSSSLKYQLIDSDTEACPCEGTLREESESTEDWYTRKPEVTKRSQRQPCRHIKRQSRWYWMLLPMRRQAQSEALKRLMQLDTVSYTAAQKFASSAVITDEMIKAVEECNDLAPLHNPANLIGIRVCCRAYARCTSGRCI